MSCVKSLALFPLENCETDRSGPLGDSRFFGTNRRFRYDFLVNAVLDDVQARVLGALLEKEITTPDYYPLSLNSLTNACNQKSNRDPAMNLSEGEVRDALAVLHDNSLARSVSAADSRVTKYEHRLQEAFNFDRREGAIFCELLLRGPQTPGELRSRAERMHHFDDLGEVQSTLQRLMSRDPALVKVLPRQVGTKEARYAHLLSGDVFPQVVLPAGRPPERAQGAEQDRITRLESELADLRADVSDLKQQLAIFRKQFE